MRHLSSALFVVSCLLVTTCTEDPAELETAPRAGAQALSVNAELELTQPNPSALVLDDYSAREAIAASIGGTSFAAWKHAGPIVDLRGARVSDQNQLLGYGREVLASATQFGLAASSSHFLFLWRDTSDGLVFQRYDSAGLAVDGVPVGVSDTSIHEPPTVTSDGTDFLVLWTRSVGQIYGARVQADGTVLDPEGVLLVDAAGAEAPALASNGTDNLVVWEQGGEILGTLIPVGTLSVTPTSFHILSGADAAASPGVVSNGTDFLVTYDPATTTIAHGKRVQTDGTVLDDGGDSADLGLALGLTGGGWGSAAMASDGSDYLLVTRTPSGMSGQRVTSAGALLDGAGFEIHAEGGHFSRAVTFNGTDYVVFWEISDGNSNEPLYARRVQTDGTLLDLPDPAPVAATIGEDESSPRLAASDTQLLVVWQALNPTSGMDVRGARVLPDGTVLDPTGIDIAISATSQHAPAVASDGTDFFVVWDESDPTDHIRGARVLADGSTPDGAGVVLVDNDAAQKPQVSWGGSSYLVAWEDWSAAGRTSSTADVAGLRVGADATPVDAEPFSIGSSSDRHYLRDIAAGGEGWALTWQRGSVHIYCAQVGFDGAVTTPPSGLAIFRGDFVGNIAYELPAVASNGTDFLFVFEQGPWQDSAVRDIYGRRMRADGAWIDADSFLISDEDQLNYAPRVASRGLEYMVTWQQGFGGAVEGRRVGSDASVLGAAQLALASGTANTPQADLSRGADDRYLLTYVGGDNGKRIQVRLLLEQAGDDLDSDGTLDAVDCAPNDGAVPPGSGAEICGDNIDNDCDGAIDEADGTGAATYYLDRDWDGYGDDSSAFTACSAPAHAVDVAGDCDDTAASANPDGVEVCDALDVDEDCDGDADDADASVDSASMSTFYADADGDGYGAAAGATAQRCDPGGGFAATNDDCDDTAAAINPGALELCDPDDVDEDCDGLADSADSSATGQSLHFPDLDGDGYGLADDPGTLHCDPPVDTAPQAGDCDDTAAAINPGADEVCDALDVDEDCDGLADDLDDDAISGTLFHVDADGDGYGAVGDPGAMRCEAAAGFAASADDCDDAVAGVNPGADEVCDPLDVDEDCDGDADDADADVTGLQTLYADADGDGYGDPASTAQACDPLSAWVTNGDDCDDNNAAVTPDIVWYADTDGDDYGDPATTTTACAQPSGYVRVGTDCDDTDADNWVSCATCVDADGDFFRTGCDSYGVLMFEDCDDTDPDIRPAMFDLPHDGIDQDCNGVDGQLCYLDGDGDGQGGADTVESTNMACNDPGHALMGGDCDDSDATMYMSADELCDAIDSDCDGSLVDGFPDFDGDWVPDCVDSCPSDPDKSEPGACGCGVVEDDADGDGVCGAADNCPGVANADQTDSDSDGVGDACEGVVEVDAGAGADASVTPRDGGGADDASVVEDGGAVGADATTGGGGGGGDDGGGEDEGCGCAASASPRSSWAALGLLALLVLRRARRRGL